MAKKTRKICCMAEQHCLAPAGYGSSQGCGANPNLPSRLPECASCGRDVCRNCSYIRQKERLCQDCFEAKYGLSAEITVWTRRFRLAGYTNCRELAKQELAQEAGEK